MRFLDLPPEIRIEIFTTLFQSVYIRYPGRREEHHLAILEVCRQIYREAKPLALPNVRVWCRRNAGVIDTLTRMGPAQVPYLRFLTVGHSPVGFKLFPSAGELEAAAEDSKAEAERDPEEDSDTSSEPDGPGDGIRYFHLGSILGLFPGLQLDLLKVFCDTGSTSYTHCQTNDCFGSLLEADGYRRLWMKAQLGDAEWMPEAPSTARWKYAIDTRLKPHSGWEVRVKIPSDGYSELVLETPSWGWESPEYCTGPWKLAADAGVALVQTEDEDKDEDEQDLLEDYGYDHEDAVDIVINRGDADFAVKAGDNRALRCIDIKDDGESPRFIKEASDALKTLFKENSWEAIKAMDEFDDGELDSWYQGDAVYEKKRRYG